MQASPSQPTPEAPRSLMQRGGFSLSRAADPMFLGLTALLAGVVLLLTLWIGRQLWIAAYPSIQEFGPKFLTTSTWDPIQDVYGAWPYIFGTLISACIALILAVPIGVGTAIFLAELAPRWMRSPLSFMVELLAAVPSVVYGLWGRLVLVPALRPFQAWLVEHLDQYRLFGGILVDFHVIGIHIFIDFDKIRPFAGPPIGYSMMAGGLILAIMVLPFITAVSREVIKAVPPTQREAAFGLGATHWEAVKGPILRTARSGIIGAIILGLARALGETMAITMVIGNGNAASWSLLAPANTLSSKLALEFAEASGKQLPALMYLALVLFSITIIVNGIARLFIWNMARSLQGAARA